MSVNLAMKSSIKCLKGYDNDENRMSKMWLCSVFSRQMGRIRLHCLDHSAVTSSDSCCVCLRSFIYTFVPTHAHMCVYKSVHLDFFVKGEKDR